MVRLFYIFANLFQPSSNTFCFEWRNLKIIYYVESIYLISFDTEKSRIIFRFIFSCENFNNFFFCCCGKIIQRTVSSISNRESTKRGSDCQTVWLAEQVSDQTWLNFLSSIIQKVKNVLSVLSFLFIKTSSSFFILLFIFV